MRQRCTILVVAALAMLATLRVATAAPADETSLRPADGRARPSVVFLGSANNPPFLWVDRTGTPRGFTVELMEALAREGGFTVTFDIIRRQQRRQAFRAGRGDVIGLEPNTPDAEGTIPLVPLWRSRELVLFASPRLAPKTLADLADETIAVLEASSQHLSLNALPRATRPIIQPVETMQQALEKLRSGEVTAVFAHSLAVRAAGEDLRASRLTAHEIRAVPFILAARAGREDLQPLFAAAYLRLQESGELMEIIERSLMDRAGGSEVNNAAFAFLVVLGLGGLALLVMGWWSRSLLREVQRRKQELKDASDSQTLSANVLSQVADAIVIVDA